MASFQITAEVLLKQISEIKNSSLKADNITDVQSFFDFFTKYLKFVKKDYSENNGIKIMLIIDEANHYYSLFRQYKRGLILQGAEPITKDGK